MTANYGATYVGADLDVPLVAVEPQDTNGRLLRLQTRPTSHIGVAERLVIAAGLTVRLEILSASHRVVLRGGDGSSIHETVACAGAAPDAEHHRVPGRYRWAPDGWQVDFSSELLFGSDALDQALATVRNVCSKQPGSHLIGRFPGHDQALTALATNMDQPEQPSWRSWHLYPGSDPHIVTTSTTATRTERRP